ncbi:MAG: glycoside hydrolase family 31 protein [Bacteroidales bacterium]
MKILWFFLIIPVLGFSQSYSGYNNEKGNVNILLGKHILSVIPLNDNSVRIQYRTTTVDSLPEIILVKQKQSVQYTCNESATELIIALKNLLVCFNKSDENLQFKDRNGNLFLSEKPGSRNLEPDLTDDSSSYKVTQTFESPEDEAIFGLGQFQDRNLNLRGLYRKLVQVNTQIALPFIYSSKGYGLLWHQYGLTEFNPAGNVVLLVKQRDSISTGDYQLEIPTVSGTQFVLRQQAYHRGSFKTDKEGIYTMVLDLGDMDKIHFLSIDNEPVIEQNAYWLPPAISKQVYLPAGNHDVDVVCKWSSTPKVSWKPFEKTTTFSSEKSKMLDYVVFYGPEADSVMENYSKLTGSVPMLPIWAYGFWQSRERYISGKQLVNTVKEFRNRNIPMDVIVQDWQYWGKHGWGVPKLDESRYPKPGEMIKDLHRLNAKLVISVWSTMDKFSETGRLFADKSYYIANSRYLDMLNPETRNLYWSVLNKNLFNIGVDGWWMDGNEPENDSLQGKTTFLGEGNKYRLIYPYFAIKAIWDGQRNSGNKRVCILTRSDYSGGQRFGTIGWSGQTTSSWDGFSRQIVAGLSHSLSGMPYWTSDIGGFYRPGPQQFNPGKPQYNDPKYIELLTRWFQFGVFSPVMRVHGYQSETEPWKYGKTAEINLIKMINLRYRLLPYIYSLAWKTTQSGYILMRPLVMDFKNDLTAVNHKFEYMFGPSILVSPVIRPDVNVWDVYLPEGFDWYDFWTGKKYKGGQTVENSAPLNKIPLFVKSGSILPLGKFVKSTVENYSDTLEIRVYTGKDASFDYYEDQGDGYGYENEEYSIIHLSWTEADKILSILPHVGKYDKNKKRYFKIIWVDELSGNGTNYGISNHVVEYSGKITEVKK